MITKICAQSSTDLDLTGSSGFCIDHDKSIYVVLGTDQGLEVLKSTDGGHSFSAFFTETFSSAVRDAAITIRDGKAIVGFWVEDRQGDRTSFDFNLLCIDIAAASSLWLTKVIDDSGISSAFDIYLDASGTTTLAISALYPLSPASFSTGSIFGVVTLDSNGAISSSRVLAGDQKLFTGSPSLVNKGGSAFSLFYTVHSKNILTSKDVDICETTTTDSTQGVWSTPALVASYNGCFTDDCLSVLQLPNGALALAQGYWSYTNGTSLVGSILYGVKLDGQPWVFRNLVGSESVSYTYPVVCQDSSNSLHLAYLCKQIGASTLSVFNVDLSTLALTPRTGQFSTKTYSQLKGTKSQADNVSKWSLVAAKNLESGGSEAYYVSEKNLPPVAAFTPESGTVKRGTLFMLDASTTSDPDQDILTYTWSIASGTSATFVGSGAKVGLLVDKSVGPDASTTTVQLNVADGQGNSSTTTHTFDIPFNAAPVVSFSPSERLVSRNTTIKLSPTIADADNDSLTVAWQQTAGTTVKIEPKGLEASVQIYNTLPVGETLAFTCSVSDGVNTPVTASISLIVPPVSASQQDLGVLKPAMMVDTGEGLPRTIAQRHDTCTLSPLSDSTLRTDFFNAKTYSYSRQTTLFIGQSSVLLAARTTSASSVTYNASTSTRFIAPEDATIYDACMLENYDVAMLLSDKRIHVLSVSTKGGTGLMTEWPDYVIDRTWLASYNGKFYGLEVSKTSKGFTTFCVYGSNGLVLIQVDSKYNVTGSLRISTDSGLLYGSSNVTFVRMVNVASITSGKLLVGTVNDNGETFETMIDLGSRSITGTWDATLLINQVVKTGELFDQRRTLGILPQAPILSATLADNKVDVALTWKQPSGDVVNAYQIETTYGTPGSWYTLVTINTGLVTYFNTQIEYGSSASYRVRAINDEGAGPWNNEVAVGVKPAPVLLSFDYDPPTATVTYYDGMTYTDTINLSTGGDTRAIIPRFKNNEAGNALAFMCDYGVTMSDNPEIIVDEYGFNLWFTDLDGNRLCAELLDVDMSGVDFSGVDNPTPITMIVINADNPSNFIIKTNTALWA